MTMIRELKVGSAFGIADVRPAVCPVAHSQIIRVHYDRDAHIARATRDMKIGDVVAVIGPSALAIVQQGEKLLLQASVGAVTVSHAVTALTDSGVNHAASPVLLVIASDGSLITAPVADLRKL